MRLSPKRQAIPRLLWLGGLFVLAVVLGICAASWIFKSTELRLPVRNQAATVRLPAPIQAKARIANDLDILVRGEVQSKVPIDQVVEVPIQDTLHTVITFDHAVPVKMDVPISVNIPLDQTLHVDSTVQVKVMGQHISLPIRGDIPVKAQIPLKLTVPVDQQIHLKFVAPADATLKQTLKVPLKTSIDARIPIQGAMQVPVKSDLEAQVIINHPIPALITHSDLTIPLSQLGLRRMQVDMQPAGSTKPSGQQP